MANTYRIKYTKSADYKVFYSNTVYGGLINQDHININFLSDRAVLPISEEVQLDDDGKAISKPNYIKEDSDIDLSREAQTGVILNLAAAKLLVSWLQEKITLAESLPK